MTPEETELLQLDYLTLCRKVLTLERQVRELRAARIVRQYEQPCGEDEEATQED